jgi:Inner membrane component domain
VVKRPEAGGASVVGNVIWLVFAGCWLALLHLASAPLLAITIIGLPLAVANVKLVPAALWPFGREIVRSADVSAALAAYRAHQAGPRPSTSSSGRSLRTGRVAEGCRGAAGVGAGRATET